LIRERLILTSDCGFARQAMSRMHAYYKMVALIRSTNIVRKELGLPEAYIPYRTAMGWLEQSNSTPYLCFTPRSPACQALPANKIG
jgi:hypothetical protein